MVSIAYLINLVFSGIQFLIGLALMGTAVFTFSDGPAMAFLVFLVGFGAIAVSYAALKFKKMFADSDDVGDVLKDRKFYIHVAIFSMPIVGIIIGVLLALP